MLTHNKNKLSDNERILRRLIKNHVKPYGVQLLLAAFFMAISAICTAVIARMVQPLIDQLFLTRDTKMLLVLPIATISTFCIKGLSEYYQNYLVSYIGQKILSDLQLLMYKHLLFADLDFIQHQSSGKLISRFTNDIILMRGAVSHLLVGCAKYSLSILFLVGLMFSLDYKLSLFIFLVFPLAIYKVQKLGRRMRNVSRKTQEELGHYTATLDETFYAIKIIKSFSAETIEFLRAKEIINKILDFYKKTAKIESLTSPIMEVLCGIAVALIIWYGGISVLNNKITAGEFFAFLAAFFSAYRPFKSLIALNVNLQTGLAAAKRIFEVLDTTPLIQDITSAKKENFITPKITFCDVELKFSNKNALRSVSFEVPASKTLAIVGRSGSGKTSIVNLLVRFYDPTAGKILINDINIKDISLKSLRQQIGLVTQDVILFNATVASNIAYGSDLEDMDRIIAAAKSADAHDFIMQLPQQYNTIIGYQGMTLSGGQKQRLSIARAFFKNAPILILDEATSSLDPNSEKSVVQSINKLCQGKTTIIITHNLSNINTIDNIMVMKSGKIVEIGSHEKLLQNQDEYYNLYTTQDHHNDKP